MEIGFLDFRRSVKKILLLFYQNKIISSGCRLFYFKLTFKVKHNSDVKVKNKTTNKERITNTMLETIMNLCKLSLCGTFFRYMQNTRLSPNDTKIITFCNKSSTDGFVISEFLPQHFVAEIIKQSSQIKT